MRFDHRSAQQMRPVSLEIGVSKFAEGSCLVKMGDTHVLCTATLDKKVPPFLRNTGTGWVTAEYGMLPRCSEDRMDREAVRGKQNGRTQEIQRLIGRSLRAVTDLKMMGERQVKIDCDVLQADGGTRVASITGAYVALYQALEKLYKARLLSQMPLKECVAAISCGIYEGKALLDLNYVEDSQADVDANFVMTGSGDFVEIQSTGEKTHFSMNHFQDMLELAKLGITELVQKQKMVLGID
jgi:ribonuclease PH